MAKAQKTPEEKAIADQKRKDNLAAANKKKAEERAAAKAKENPPTIPENPAGAGRTLAEAEAIHLSQTEESKTPAIAEMSSEFEAILADIRDGKEVTIEDEPGVYFKFEDNRLKKYSKQGGHMDSYPLWAFQNRKGWGLNK